jgi:hypothetical protein
MLEYSEVILLRTAPSLVKRDRRNGVLAHARPVMLFAAACVAMSWDRRGLAARSQPIAAPVLSHMARGGGYARRLLYADAGADAPGDDGGFEEMQREQEPRAAHEGAKDADNADDQAEDVALPHLVAAAEDQDGGGAGGFPAVAEEGADGARGSAAGSAEAGSPQAGARAAAAAMRDAKLKLRLAARDRDARTEGVAGAGAGASSRAGAGAGDDPGDRWGDGAGGEEEARGLESPRVGEAALEAIGAGALPSGPPALPPVEQTEAGPSSLGEFLAGAAMHFLSAGLSALRKLQAQGAAKELGGPKRLFALAAPLAVVQLSLLLAVSGPLLHRRAPAPSREMAGVLAGAGAHWRELLQFAGMGLVVPFFAGNFADKHLPGAECARIGLLSSVGAFLVTWGVRFSPPELSAGVVAVTVPHPP